MASQDPGTAITFRSRMVVQSFAQWLLNTHYATTRLSGELIGDLDSHGTYKTLYRGGMGCWREEEKEESSSWRLCRASCGITRVWRHQTAHNESARDCAFLPWSLGTIRPHYTLTLNPRCMIVFHCAPFSLHGSMGMPLEWKLLCFLFLQTFLFHPEAQ